MKKLLRKSGPFFRRVWAQRPFRRFRSQPAGGWDSPHTPAFLRRAKPGSFAFFTSNGFSFFDGFKAPGQYFILRDGKNRSRFVLRYSINQGRCTIYHVQRDYSRILRRLGAFFSREGSSFRQRIRVNESRDSKVFQEQLGCHPAEFLMGGFLYWLRKRGVDLSKVDYVYSPRPHAEVQRPVLDRFFREEESSPDGVRRFVLSPQKRRVKEILGEK